MLDTIKPVLHFLSKQVYESKDPVFSATIHTKNPNIIVNRNGNSTVFQYVLMTHYDPQNGKSEFVSVTTNNISYIKFEVIDTVLQTKRNELVLLYPSTEEEFFQQSTVHDMQDLSYEEYLELPKYLTAHLVIGGQLSCI